MLTSGRAWDGRLWAVAALSLLVCGIDAKAVDHEFEALSWDGSWHQLALVSVAGLACGIILLIGCAGLCDRETAFKVWRQVCPWWAYDQLHTDFDNDESFVVEPPPAGPAAEFSMYPPVESTPDIGGLAPVYFEPLPDITSKLKPRVSNATVLRPKVGVVNARMLDREDSEDGLDDFPPRDSIQDKMKLQSLVNQLSKTTTLAGVDPSDPANSRNQLPRSQLQYIKELGTGYFGKVLQGEGHKILPGYKKTKVVIQMLNEESDPHDQLTFLQEAAPYREIDHPNVLKVLGQCVETTPYLVVLELCPFGDLKSYLRSHRVAIDSFNEKGLLLKFASDMAAGLQVLHQHNYVHHDFAARNCLLASDLTVKVGDYGLSEETFKEDYYFDGNGDPVPIRWLAPESLHICQDGSLAVRKVTKQANVWSYGVALWEVIQFGALPYTDLSNEHVLRLVVKQHIIHLSKPDMPIDHMDRLFQLMQLCWSEPSQRPTLRELRIMLLHLLSRKGTYDDTTFEQKWNQLLPRRPPQITKVTEPSVTTPIATVSSNGGLHAAYANQPQPSGFESNFVELNASLLARQSQTGNPLEDELPQVHNSQPDSVPRSPTNELSLEAELSAVFDSSSRNKEVNNSLSVDLLAANQTNQTEGPSLEEELAKADAKSANEESSKAGVVGSTPILITDDQGISELSMPDIVTTSTIKGGEASPDFVTSTPGKDSEDHKAANQSDTFTTAPEANSGYGPFQSSSMYRTALTSHQTSSQGEEDDGSLLGQRNFAALLQTVAAPSFDGDEFDVLSSSFGSSLDRSIDEVFNEFNATSTGNGNYQKVSTDDGKSANVTVTSKEGNQDSLLVTVSSGDNVENANKG